MLFNHAYQRYGKSVELMGNEWKYHEAGMPYALTVAIIYNKLLEFFKK